MRLRARSACRELDLGRGVECARDIVGEQQLGLGGEGAGQGEALHLTAGQPDPAVADQRRRSARRLHVGAEPGVVDRLVDGARVVEPDVVGERARTAPAAPGRRGRPDRGAGTSRASVDRRRRSSGSSPVCSTRPASAASRLDLPEPTCPSSSTSSPGSDDEVDVARRRSCRRRAPRSTPVQLEPLQRRPRCGHRRRAAPVTRSTPCGHRCIRSPPPASRQVACGHARVPGASVIDRAGDPSEPVEAVDRAGDQQRGGQVPATGRRRTAQAATDAGLDHDDRDAVEDRLDAVLAHRGVDPAVVDLAQVACTDGRGRGQLDRARRLERRDQRAPEAGPGGRRRGRRAPGDRRPSADAAAETTMTASSTPPASSCRPTTAVTATIARPLTRSTQRSA